MNEDLFRVEEDFYRATGGRLSRSRPFRATDERLYNDDLELAGLSPSTAHDSEQLVELEGERETITIDPFLLE